MPTEERHQTSSGVQMLSADALVVDGASLDHLGQPGATDEECNLESYSIPATFGLTLLRPWRPAGPGRRSIRKARGGRVSRAKRIAVAKQNALKTKCASRCAPPKTGRHAPRCQQHRLAASRSDCPCALCPGPGAQSRKVMRRSTVGRTGREETQCDRRMAASDGSRCCV